VHHILSRYIYAYVVGPFVGAIIAGFIYKCYSAEMDEPEEEDEATGKGQPVSTKDEDNA